MLDGVTTAGSTVNVYATSNLAVPVKLNPGLTSGEDVFGNLRRPTATAIGASRQMLDLNNTTYFTKDGERDLIATATDAGGDARGHGVACHLRGYRRPAGRQRDLYQHRPGRFRPARPAPPTGRPTAIDIVFTDAATRSGPFSNLPALNNILAHETSNYQLSGQTTGVDPITAIYFTDETQAGGPGTTDIQLTFANPLVDDVHTLSIFDTLMNDAGNKLDGEVTAASGGTDTIVLPSGNGVPGGNFVATFAVQANTELAVAMTQGVQFFNLKQLAWPVLTMTAPFGNPSDILFTGNLPTRPRAWPTASANWPPTAKTMDSSASSSRATTAVLPPASSRRCRFPRCRWPETSMATPRMAPRSACIPARTGICSATTSPATR